MVPIFSLVSVPVPPLMHRYVAQVRYATHMQGSWLMAFWGGKFRTLSSLRTTPEDPVDNLGAFLLGKSVLNPGQHGTERLSRLEGHSDQTESHVENSAHLVKLTVKMVRDVCMTENEVLVSFDVSPCSPMSP